MRNILSFEILIVKVSKVSSLHKCFVTVLDGLFEILELGNNALFEISISNMRTDMLVLSFEFVNAARPSVCLRSVSKLRLAVI